MGQSLPCRRQPRLNASDLIAVHLEFRSNPECECVCSREGVVSLVVEFGAPFLAEKPAKSLVRCTHENEERKLSGPGPRHSVGSPLLSLRRIVFAFWPSRLAVETDHLARS